MAIAPKDLLTLTEDQVKKLNDLEAELDGFIKNEFKPYNKELKIPILGGPLSDVEVYHLERRYHGIGWSSVIVDRYPDSDQGPVLILEFDTENFGIDGPSE